MTRRVLPPDEWHRLPAESHGLPDGEQVWAHLDPAQSVVHVIEADGRIVGTVTMLRVVHAECVWIDPAYRGQFGVVRRILAAMSETARAWGARRMWGAGLTAQMFGILYRLGGVKVPGIAYVFPVTEASCRPS